MIFVVSPPENAWGTSVMYSVTATVSVTAILLDGNLN